MPDPPPPRRKRPRPHLRLTDVSSLPHFFDFTPETLGAWCESQRMPVFRAKQIMEWVYAKGVIDPMAMSNLSQLDRTRLRDGVRFLSGDVVQQQNASDGTTKLLIAWHGDEKGSGTKGQGEEKSLSLPVAGAKDDRKTTECVMIPSEDRRTACISSQVGCPVGCKFCASGVGGLESNLTGGRIVEQVWRLRDMLRTHPMHASVAGATQGEFPRITNVVFMGMGEIGRASCRERVCWIV